MADRKAIIRRRPVEEEEQELEEEVEEVEEEEVEEEAPARKPRKVEIDDEEEEAPAPVKKAAAAPVKKVAAPAPKAAPAPVAKKVAPKVAVVEDDDEPEPVKAAPAKVSNLSHLQIESLLLMTLENLEAGKSIVISRNGDDKWTVASGTAVAAAAPSKPKLTGKAFQEAVCTPEYLEWQERWTKMSAEERLAEIKKAKVKWEEAENDLVNTMRATTAYMEKMGIEKYKPEFKTPSSRAAIKG